MLIQRDVPFKHAVLYTATGVQFGLKIACSLEFRHRLSKNVTHKLHQAKNCGLNSFSSFYCLPCWQTSVTENSWRLEIRAPRDVPNDFRLLQVRANDLSNDLRKRNGCLLSGCIYTALIVSLDIHKWHQHNSILTERQREGKRRGMKKYKEGVGSWKRAALAIAGLFFWWQFSLAEEKSALESKKKEPRPPTSLQNCFVIWWYHLESHFVHSLPLYYARLTHCLVQATLRPCEIQR